ncbi:MAG: colicin V production protein [Thiobacillus sp. 63-78]|uniref:CvpA family protein n=1 Tax=Thiobacillus sp. 63-78 TaxID=1895859 RepID=UPI00086E4F19|nr:CvpA family protein [Thiobacillus sp. 63-78]MBN8762556.1 CvpA family protein [Thiobacillus sp.]ODV12929.1 MAG: colicin V production protein [Thiobacillus sp. SCN 64-317]MBN8766958.1 CvpA family protein [Thiobacillus sp.]MBN8774957.1 CvpA family protein [Thiobacillus sp.]OJZ08174.1 MAG: colicin V production protein [Thiobacillus sp. 63-78]
MSMLDLIVLLVLVLTVVRGLMRGMVDTLFSLAAWILAFVLGRWGALLVAPLLPMGIESPGIRYFAGFAVVFLVVLIGVLLLGHVLSSLVRAAGLGGPDKMLGGVLGLVKGLTILVGLTLAAGLTSLPRTEFWKQAWVSDSLQAMAQRTLPLVPADVAKYIRFE